MPTNDTWKGGTGDWALGSNWSADAAPGTLDAAIFNTISDATLSNVEYENIASLDMALAGAILDIQGELTIGGAHLNGVANTIDVTAGTLKVDGGGLIAGQFVSEASGVVRLANQGTYQWNGAGSTQYVDMGHSYNDTFQFSTPFGGTIGDFFAGGIISYSGTVNSVVVGNNTVTFNATNGQSYVINLVGGVYNASNIIVNGNTIETTRTFHPINDFNGDGLTDVLWRNTSGAMSLWKLNESGGFTYSSIGTAISAWQVGGVGDFNGDGDADILWRNTSTGAVLLWDSNGSGGFTYPNIGTVSSNLQVAGVGDFNGDGLADILWRNTSTGAVQLWDSNGSGGFTQTNIGSAVSAWQIGGVGDFNGDGEADILWRNNSTGAVELWDSNGSGGFTYHNIGTANSSWQIGGVGDFNGDGLADILWRNTSTGAVSLWETKASGGYTYAAIGTVNSTWQIGGVGDFNGDGLADILWRNTSGAVEIWASKPSGGFTYLSLGTANSTWSIAAA